MGCDDSPHREDGEGPARQVWVDEFVVSSTAVSNREFAEFVEATGYRTEAERLGSSFVFPASVNSDGSSLNPGNAAPGWREVPQAIWSAPEGEGTELSSRWDHPVVHVTHQDAEAYCRWSETRLPTEAEWEFAARGGLAEKPFPWGDELEPDGHHRCNVWQGNFPYNNLALDGYAGTAPVDAFPPNGYGLYNACGNVWEWVADRFARLHCPRPVRNPKGPLNGERHVARGGSFLCHESYCLRYRTSSRQGLSRHSSASNLGFRVVHY